MRALHRAAPLALMLLLGACTSGGSGSSGAPVAPITAPFVPNTGQIPIAVVVPNRTQQNTSVARSPRYVSAGTASVALYDGSTLVYVGNYNQSANPQFTTLYAITGTTSIVSGACVAGGSSSTCTITVQTSIGSHTFGVVTYPNSQVAPPAGTVPSSFSGVILAEGQLTVNVVAGTNPTQTEVPLGVADLAVFTPPTLTQRLNGNGPLVGVIGTTYTFQYVINDSANQQIIQPGNYDNAPVAITETDAGAIVTMTPISQSSPPPSTGNQSFTVVCANNGTATITASVQTHPNATYASGLTYTSSNYPTATIGTTTLQCVPNSGTLPVTVQ
jgi:hypothetical protein